MNHILAFAFGEKSSLMVIAALVILSGMVLYLLYKYSKLEKETKKFKKEDFDEND